MARHFVPPADLKGGADAMEKEIVWLVCNNFGREGKSHLKYFPGHNILTHKSYFYNSFLENHLKLMT